MRLGRKRSSCLIVIFTVMAGMVYGVLKMGIALPWAVGVLAFFLSGLAVGLVFEIKRLEKMVFDAEARLLLDLYKGREKDARRRWRILEEFLKESDPIKQNESLFLTQLRDRISRFVPPPFIPKKAWEDFTMKGRIPVTYCYHDDAYSGEEAIVFEEAEIKQLREKVRKREECGYIGTDRLLYRALENFPINGMRVAVIGSVRPWYETVALEFGARSCLTIEYNRIISSDPLIQTLTPKEFELRPEVVDAVFSISSFEHDGLGRYGDNVSPNADLEAMNKVRSMLRPGGYLYLSVPIGRDLIIWNAHRIYGNLRFPLLIAGWEEVARYGCDAKDFDRNDGKEGNFQPVFVLKKIN